MAERTAALPALTMPELTELARALDVYLRVLGARREASPPDSALRVQYDERIAVVRSVATAVIETSHHVGPRVPIGKVDGDRWDVSDRD